MGSGIALVLLQAGFAVTLVDIAKPALDKGLQQIHKIVQGFVAKKKLPAAKAKTLLSQLSSTQKLESLTNVQLVVEAVVERMKIKKSIFTSLDKVTPPSCILLSNTSTLDVDEMASVLSPQRQTTFAGKFSRRNALLTNFLLASKRLSSLFLSVNQDGISSARRMS